MINKITFILTIYNPKEQEILYWNNIYKKIILSGHQFIVILDNPNYNLGNNFVNATILKNKENLGKFISVLKSKKYWKHDFIKILDPDDYVSIERINTISKILLKNELNIMNSVRINKKLKNFSDENIDKLFNKIKGKRYSGTGNSTTILPSDFFKENDWKEFGNIKLNDDQMLGQICISRDIKINYINDSFYLYVKDNGVTNPKNFKDYLNKFKVTLLEYFYFYLENNYINIFEWPSSKYLLNNLKKIKFKFLNKNYFVCKKEIIKINEFIKNIENFKKNSKNNMNVCFISDSIQYEYALINSKIIIDQNKINSSNLKIHLLFFDLNKEQKEYCHKFIEKFGKNKLNLIFINSSKFNLFESKIKHITNIANARLYLTEILNDDIENVLYLDNDTVVMGDIAEAFMFFDKNKVYAQNWNNNAYWSRTFSKRFNTQNNKYYFNSGVIHFPIKIMKDENSLEHFINFYNKWSKIIKYVDQDVINANLKIERMPSNFNIARNSWPKNHSWFSEFLNLKIYHFLSNEKQWDKERKEFINGSLTDEEKNNLLKAKKFWQEQYEKIKK